MVLLTISATRAAVESPEPRIFIKSNLRISDGCQIAHGAIQESEPDKVHLNEYHPSS